jgi:Na+/H+-dicarboxylate symporter
VAVAGLTAVLSIVCRKAPWRVLSDLGQPLVIAFATDNPLAALYSAIEALQERFGVDRRVVDTVTPFGVLANQHGQVLLLTFTVIFLAQVYGVSLGTAAIVIVAVSCLISGAAAVGGGPALVPILAPILLNAQIPDALAVVVLATTQPAVAPLVSLLTVLGTAALTVITAKPGRSA